MDVLRRVIDAYEKERATHPINMFTAGEVDLVSDYHALLKSMEKLESFFSKSPDAGGGEVEVCLPGESLHESKMVIYMSKNTKPTNRLLKQANVELSVGHYKLGEDVKKRIKDIGSAQRQDSVKCLIVPVFYTDGDDFYIFGLVFDCYDAIVLDKAEDATRRVYFVHSTNVTKEGAEYEGFRNYLKSSDEMAKYGFVLYDSFCKDGTLLAESKNQQLRLDNFQASLFQFYNFAMHPGDAVTYAKGSNPEYSINNDGFWQKPISSTNLEEMRKMLGTTGGDSDESEMNHTVKKKSSKNTTGKESVEKKSTKNNKSKESVSKEKTSEIHGKHSSHKTVRPKKHTTKHH